MAFCRNERMRLANKNAIVIGAGQGPATAMRLLAERRSDKNKKGTMPRCAFYGDKCGRGAQQPRTSGQAGVV